jgi:hypothetical protein
MPPLHRSIISSIQCLTGTVCAIALIINLWGCSAGFKTIDRRVDELLEQTSEDLGPDATPPGPSSWPTALGPRPSGERKAALINQHPPTVNPAANELAFRPMDESTQVLDRLRAYNEVPSDALTFDLTASLAFATRHSREYKFAEEDYVLAALRLLIERHLWGPIFFDNVSAAVVGIGDDGLFNTSLELVNELGVTQRLPYGGTVSASALALATEDLHQRVAGENVQSADILLAAEVPLLRGAGTVAQEELIQLEREMIYGARRFEDFRRQFLFDIARDFLDLVVQQQAVVNAERQVESLREVAARERALYEAGRTPRFQAALAEQSTVTAVDDLVQRQENYRLAVDRFKVRLGMEVEQALIIDPATIDLPVPDTSLDAAVRMAMTYRLDLQTERDTIDDARRQLDNRRNALLPDLNLTGAINIPTDPDKQRAGVDFDPGFAEFEAGVTFGLPLDREIERINVRQAQITLERTLRQYDERRDNIAVLVRADVRDIDRARYSLEIQERNIGIGEQRVASINAAPDRATARDASEAANDLAQARDARDSARRDLQVAILRYLLDSGQLRVNPQGMILPLRGMPEGADEPTDPDIVTPPAVSQSDSTTSRTASLTTPMH